MLSDRVRSVRKSANLSMRAFGESIGVSVDVIKNLEYNRVAVPSEIVLRSICEKYGINRVWLDTGEGDMFPEPADEDVQLIDVLAKLTASEENPRKKRMISTFCRFAADLSDSEIDKMKDFFDALSASLDPPQNDGEEKEP